MITYFTETTTTSTHAIPNQYTVNICAEMAAFGAKACGKIQLTPIHIDFRF